MKRGMITAMCILAAAWTGWTAAQLTRGSGNPAASPGFECPYQTAASAPGACPYLRGYDCLRGYDPGENAGPGSLPPACRRLDPEVRPKATMVELGAAASDPGRFAAADAAELQTWEKEDNEWEENWGEGPEADEGGEVPEVPEDELQEPGLQEPGDEPPAEVDFLLISWLGRDAFGEPVSGTILVRVGEDAQPDFRRPLATCLGVGGPYQYR